MPEIEEVFRMATQKVRQDPGALDRQMAKQERATRNRRVSAFVMVFVLLAAAVAAYALTRGDTGEVPANGTAVSVPQANGSTVDVRTGEVTPLSASIATSGDYYAVSPDHTTVAFNACCTASSPVFVANVDGTQIRQISGGDAYAARWSSDGSMLVYQQRDSSTYHLGNLFVANVATGQQTQVTNFDQTQDWGSWAMLPSFTADGRSILFQLPRGDHPNHPTEDLWSVPVTGGTQTLVRRNASSGAYSPDGGSLVYVSPVGAKDALWVTSVHGGTPRVLVQGDPGWLRWSPDGTRISYWEARSIYVLNVASGSATKVAEGGNAEWFDDNTLIVAYPPN
jgi:Tol biopolymer transport system component